MQHKSALEPMVFPGVVNICFHGVGTPRRPLEPGEDGYWVDTDRFLTLLDVVAAHRNTRITLDDGNESDVEIVLPALLERGLTAEFFVVAGRLDTPGSLRSSDLHDLTRNGMKVGNHGMSHRPWAKMSPTTRTEELAEARDRISAAARSPVGSAACPHGGYDRRLLSHLRHLGYTLVYTSDQRPARPGAWLQPRFSVHLDDTAESLRARVLRRSNPLRRVVLGAVGVAKRLR